MIFTYATIRRALLRYFCLAVTLCAASGGLPAQTQTGADLATGMDFDRFGGVVAVTRDGRRIAVAAPRGDRNGNSDAGAVRVYDLVNGVWQQVGGELRGTPGAWFGSAVAFSADGNTLAVGAPLQQFGAGRNGAVTVFNFVNGGFTSVGSLFGAGADDQFGYSVALSDDGRALAVGAPQDDSPSNQQNASPSNQQNAGSASLYRLSGGSYRLQGSPVYGDSFSEGAGRAVALSGDGRRMAVGSPLFQNNFTGRARVFDYDAGAWTQVGTALTEGSAGQFGASLDLSRDGTRLVVAAANTDVGTARALGAVYTYDLVSGAWAAHTNVLRGTRTGDRLGSAVSLSEDGTRLLVGAAENGAGVSPRPGRVQLYERVIQTWQPLGDAVAGTQNGESFGQAVALSGDGGALIVGSPLSGTNDRGRARAYAYAARPYATFPLPVGPAVALAGPASDDQSGFSVAVSSDGRRVAVGTPRRSSGATAGEVRAYDYVDGDWRQVGPTLQGVGVGDEFGYALALTPDGTRLAVGAPVAQSAGGRNGAVYVYDLVNGTWQLSATLAATTANGLFGSTLAITPDGSRLAVAAQQAGSNFAGQVEVYADGPTAWTLVGAAVTGATGFDVLGLSLAIADDGRCFVAGGLDGIDQNGVARVYEEAAGTWTQVGADVLGDDDADYLGQGVAISGDGRRIATGSRGDDTGGADAGRARVFRLVGNTWTPLGAAVLGQSAGERLGDRVALSADGTRLVVGAPGLYNSGSRPGRVRVFDFDGAAWQPAFAPLAGAQAYDNFGFALALTPDGSHVAIGVPRSDATRPDGTAIVDAGRARVYQIAPATVLPVEFTHFAASAKTDLGGRDYVQLTWATASERGSGHFAVERSGDGRAWATIAEVAAAGHSDVRRDYRFADRRPLPGVSYYRLRQVDLDGAEAYSGVEAVAFGQAAADLSSLRLFPNPTRGSVMVAGIPDGAPVSATLADLAGRQHPTRLLPGGRVDLAGVPAGVYALSLRTAAGVATRRLIVE